MGIIRGQVTFTERSRSRRWSQDSGWQTIIEYVGPTDDLDANVESARVGALDLTVAHSAGPISTMTVTYGDQQAGESEEETNAYWELLAEDTQHDLWDAPGFSTLSEEDKVKFQKALADYEAGEWKEGTNPYEFSLESQPDIDLLLKVARISKSYTSESWVLRKTQVIGSYYRVRFNQLGASPSDLDITLRGVGNIFSTSQLISTEPALPSSIVAALNAYPVQPTKDNFYWGWLKRIPTLTSKAGNKLDAVQEFRMGYYPATYYSTYA